jgi:aminoglycoside 6'-N-acetyltransferase I
MQIYRLEKSAAQYIELRTALWPDSAEEHEREIEWMLERPEKWALFVAEGADRRLLGMVEVSLREYAEGAASAPVGYLEGWYVRPEWRGLGVGRALVEAGEAWVREKGCGEIASDTQIENEAARFAHERLGYREVERQVCFLKELKR